MMLREGKKQVDKKTRPMGDGINISQECEVAPRQDGPKPGSKDTNFSLIQQSSLQPI